MTLGKWLRRNGKSQEWLAAEVDGACTQALVSKWVRGLVLPSVPRQHQIMVVTGGHVTVRGLVLRHKRMKAKIRARGSKFRAENGIDP